MTCAYAEQLLFASRLQYFLPFFNISDKSVGVSPLRQLYCIIKLWGVMPRRCCNPGPAPTSARLPVRHRHELSGRPLLLGPRRASRAAVGQRRWSPRAVTRPWRWARSNDPSSQYARTPAGPAELRNKATTRHRGVSLICRPVQSRFAQLVAAIRTGG